jgi:hypothetical protein
MYKGLIEGLLITYRFELISGMPGRLAITMLIPPGKLVKVSFGVVEFVLVGSEVSHCCRDVDRSWLGNCCL